VGQMGPQQQEWPSFFGPYPHSCISTSAHANFPSIMLECSCGRFVVFLFVANCVHLTVSSMFKNNKRATWKQEAGVETE
jgi:hypothetical protein